ncbi:hypothetical protein, partial [Bradyrhizobium brasilense]|uniref:hypothetical protein n=1 Tax=Bradyrhizobium brasilense TaxID=1419277 RepID=UPI001AEDB500
VFRSPHLLALVSALADGLLLLALVLLALAALTLLGAAAPQARRPAVPAAQCMAVPGHREAKA